MAYAKFEDYTGRFGGRAIRTEEDFDRLALRAGRVLDRLTAGKAARYRDTEGKLALACCAVAEKLAALEEQAAVAGSGALKAETVGDWRAEYRRVSLRESGAELAALAEMYLFGTGLLYRGVMCTVHMW